MNIITLNTKGGVGKSFIATQILPLAFYNNNDANINIFEIDNNNKTALSTKIIQFLNLDVNNIDKILFDVEFSEDINIIDAGGGDDTKSVIKAFAEANIQVDLFVIPITKDFEVIKNLKDTIELIKKHYDDANILIVLNRVVADAKSEFIYFFGNEEYGVESIKDKLKDVKYIAIKDYNEIDIVKNLHKTTALDLLLSYKKVLENEREYRQSWHKEAKEKYKDKEQQRAYYAKKLQKLLLIKRINNIQQNIQQLFKAIV